MIYLFILTSVFSSEVTYTTLSSTINNCVAYNGDPYNPYQEVCEICDSGYILNENRLSCSLDNSNCAYRQT